ncbi:MAG: hypothetical protein ACI8T1_002029 [Verrucomicrobiales bacterium]|jgi:hypothetical protein
MSKFLGKMNIHKRANGMVLSGIGDLHRQVVDVARLGVTQYGPVVDKIIASGCRDVPHIERTLDCLLDLCCLPSGVELFRRLCRYLWDIDTAATAFYVQQYREMWDSD